MYFPREKEFKPNRSREILSFIERFETFRFTEDQEVRILSDLMCKIDKLLYIQKGVILKEERTLSDISHILHEYEEFLSPSRTNSPLSSYNSISKEEVLKIVKQRLFVAVSSLNSECHLVEYEIKPYKSMYIFLLSRPDNNSSVVAEILSSVNYLDKMTRDVTFIMPGYSKAQINDDVCNKSDKNLQLTFDENIFIDVIKDLEDKSNGLYEYLDDCELLLLGMDEFGNYDFSNYAKLDLTRLKLESDVDSVKFIIAASKYFQQHYEMKRDMREHANRIQKSIIGNDSRSTKRVFIAGSKELKAERTLVREESTKVANVKDLDMRSLTFEDFATSLTGKDRGRQVDYNQFIENEANVVVFIFDTIAGEITEEEFNIAYDSLSANNHPDMFVYVRKHNRFMNLFMNRRLRNIKNKVFSYHKEYYVEYDNLDDLRYKFYSDMLTYFEK